jgi:phosphoglycolate phosphatase
MTHVLFWDIDGTLLTTARAGVFALEEAAREICGTDVDFAGLRTAGLTDYEVCALAIRTAGLEDDPETVTAFLRAYERHLPDRLHLRRGSVLPGVEAVLEHLAERDDVVSLLLTGNTPAGAHAKLAHYGLDRYLSDGAFCVDGGDRVSIARRALALAAERMGADVSGDQVTVIGDTPADVRCGRAIGARTIAIASGAYSRDELEEAGASVVVDELPPPERFLTLLVTAPPGLA